MLVWGFQFLRVVGKNKILSSNIQIHLLSIEIVLEVNYTTPSNDLLHILLLIIRIIDLR